MSDISVGAFRGRVSEKHLDPDFLSQLSSISTLIPAPVASGVRFKRSRVVRLDVARGGSPLSLSVKVFNAQSRVKDLVDRSCGSKARRSWLAATALEKSGVGTPAPVGFLERWDGSRLAESYFLAEYLESVTSFRDELIRLYTVDPHCWKVMALLECVASEIRKMHDAGILHGDLGNQNVLLERTRDGKWANVRFVDLNRGRARDELSLRDRAFDISRISLPSDFLRVFKEMYWREVPPSSFQKWERMYRRVFALHTITRAVRHPIRTRHEMRHGSVGDAGSRYPAETDVWIWDERSAQAISPTKSKDRRRHHSLWRDPRLAWSTLMAAGPVLRGYRTLKKEYYKNPVPMKSRVGIAVSAASEGMERRLALLDELGEVPVMIRFYHHESEKQWEAAASLVKRLSATGRSVSAALVQDRAAVKAPAKWKRFVEHVLSEIAGDVEWIEVGHAINRAKWGVWNFDEYCGMLDALSETRQAYPDAKFMGPAVIDFECPVAVTALRLAADRFRFDALSHHLYVDRRGAPENKQGGFDLVDKLALVRSIAQWAPGCDGGVIVSETNWPIVGTGVYSPVGSPYVSPGVRKNDPSVSDEVYSDYMLRYLLQATCSGMAERVYWWRLVAHGFGLIDDGDGAEWRKRPAFDAMKYFVATLGESTFEEKTSSQAGVDMLKFRNPDGSDVVVAYSVAGAISAKMPGSCSRVLDSRGNELQLTGESVELSGSPKYLL